MLKKEMRGKINEKMIQQIQFKYEYYYSGINAVESRLHIKSTEVGRTIRT